MRGYAKPDILDQFRGSQNKEIIRGQRIIRKDIEGLFTDDFWRALQLWRQYKTFGLPFPIHWTDHPANLIKLFFLFDEEEKSFHNIQAKEQMERMKRR